MQPVPKLPARYEDLDPSFRGRLRPNGQLNDLIQAAYRGMQVSGGLRFLPLYGRSGSGKSSAARELATHLEGTKVVELPRAAVEDRDELLRVLDGAWGRSEHPQLMIAIVDQFEDTVPDPRSIPIQFVERLSLLDRNELRGRPIIFIWLTTNPEFQAALADATSRNERLLMARDFELVGPPREQWADIVEETFEAHNSGTELADAGVLYGTISAIAEASDTIGDTIEKVGRELTATMPGLHDLSKYQVVMLWPVTDGIRIQRIQSFSHPRDGYKLNWGAFWRELSPDDRRTLPLEAFNRARLYFDVRLVPIATADLAPVGKNLDVAEPSIGESYYERPRLTHFFSILTDSWDPSSYAPLRERQSQRAEEGRAWYAEVTRNPTGLGRRIAFVLRHLGLDAQHEQDIRSDHGTVRADVLVKRPGAAQSEVIVELKAFSPENTMPSSIRDQIRITLRRHAQLAGFLPRQ
ncbi:ATP-binding protein [Cellulomonas iranensis]|uniref:ATP-binding protein n=1 Tax=Cellulomonas iranensis TaxID=76862 RepID=UPI001CF3E712|nr:ATP-binding protein [Cellulomonas iranensis]UCN16199.1 ATP-binding protein [Cellulomonas iranensis]